VAIVELVVLFAVSLLAFLVGRRTLAAGGCEFHTGVGRACAATALGLGVIGYCVLGVGLLSQLRLAAVLVVFACLLVWSLMVPRRRMKQASFVPPKSPDTVLARPVVPCCLLCAVAAAATLAGALAPPTAGDALCYHLEIPKRFVQLGRVCFLPLTDNSLFPFLMEMLYTLGLLLSGPVLAQLFHWLVGLLFAGAVVELATPHVGRAGGVWAGTVAMLAPCVTNEMTAPLNDLAVALYSTLMVIGCDRWQASGQKRWLLLCAVFGGLALSVKLVSAAMVIPVGALVAIRACLRQSWRRACGTVATFAVVIALTGGVWYARSWYHLGNPIYPYFNSWFGLAAHTRSTLETGHSLLELPWVATMHPERFGGRGMQLGAVFLALAPGLVIARQVGRGVWQLMGLAAGFGLFWFAIRQDLRFLLPIVPMLSIASVAVLQGLRASHRPAFGVACVCVAGLLAFQSLIVLKRSTPCWAVALGMESRADYLERHEPTYRVARFVNTQLGHNCRVISQDYRGLYFGPTFVREASLRRRHPYAHQGMGLARWLADQGFTHVLLVEAFNPETAVYDQGFAERLGPVAQQLPEVFATRFESASGDRRHYRLLKLPDAAAPVGDAALRARAAMGN